MSTSQRSSAAGSLQQGKPGAPQMPPNGLIVYGNGLVFNGNVYPVMVDGVPLSLPAAAQEAAAMQRFGMQLHGQQQPQTFAQKAGMHQPQQQQQQRQRGYQQPTQASYRHSQQNLPSQVQLQQQQLQQQLQLQLQQLQQQQPQQQQYPLQHWRNFQQNVNNSDVAVLPGAQMFSYNYDYGYVPTGGESLGWNGYASCQPIDASKPFAFGWSPTD